MPSAIKTITCVLKREQPCSTALEHIIYIAYIVHLKYILDYSREFSLCVLVVYRYWKKSFILSILESLQYRETLADRECVARGAWRRAISLKHLSASWHCRYINEGLISLVSDRACPTLTRTCTHLRTHSCADQKPHWRPCPHLMRRSISQHNQSSPVCSPQCFSSPCCPLAHSLVL